MYLTGTFTRMWMFLKPHNLCMYIFNTDPSNDNTSPVSPLIETASLNRLDWFKAPFIRLRLKATWCQKYANWCGRGLFNNTLFCTLSFQASCACSRREIMERSVCYGSYRCRQQVVGTSLPLPQVKESSYFSCGKLRFLH